MNSCRRSFLTATARAVLLVEASGLPWAESFAAAAGPPSGLVRVALADFPALAQVSGSVHVIVAATPAIFPVILTRVAADSFAAVSSRCTHSGCIVDTFSVQQNRLICSCHGSEFTAQGVVLAGPAATNLDVYAVRRLNASVLELEIPGIGFALAAAAVNTTAGPRLRLTFPTHTGLRYEVSHRATTTGPAAPLAFSLTETGALTQTSLTGTGAEVTLYLPAAAPTGFLSVIRQ
jgi:Rieske Fe-S protein